MKKWPSDFLRPASAALLILCLVTGAKSYTLQCYKCTIYPPNKAMNETERLCSAFDHSEKYIVDCPYSTMCMKKSIELKLSDGGVAQGVLRDCAAQKNDYQVYRHGQWEQETNIQEEYEEGCQIADNKGEKSSNTKYCYCRGFLCNSATSSRKASDVNYHTDAMAVIFVFNAMKYIESLR